MTDVVRLDQVSKHYRAGVTAVDGVSLAVVPGELVALVGPSGSGKSTLLHLVGLLDRPSAGSVWLAGHPVAALPDRRLSALRATAVGFVFQQSHLLPGMSALDNAADGLLYLGVSRSERRRRAEVVLRRLGLGPRLAHRSHQLSGGERQRVAIARAVVKEPRLVLADEPTGNLDSAAGAEVMAVLRSLHAAGTAVVVVTHDQEIAAGVPRRIEMRDGRITADRRGGAALLQSGRIERGGVEPVQRGRVEPGRAAP